mgnify:CR=1
MKREVNVLHIYENILSCVVFDPDEETLDTHKDIHIQYKAMVRI